MLVTMCSLCVHSTFCTLVLCTLVLCKNAFVPRGRFFIICLAVQFTFSCTIIPCAEGKCPVLGSNLSMNRGEFLSTRHALLRIYITVRI